MPKGRKQTGSGSVGDYRHKQAKRKNNPPAGLAPTYAREERAAIRYEYDPHLDPQLVWAGKAEHTSFDVDVVSLHIHERVSTRAILEAVRRPEPQLALFGNQELTADQQIEFYQHEVGWANRLILGDSLLVMNSMLVREGMAGKVQCIYIDPPYGIKYASNMQGRIDCPDVKDKDDDLTHEPEQIKAYRDTWKLGIHSYLTYLRDRLLLAKDLLSESGSVFVQIGEDNVHLVRALLDEILGRDNFAGAITFLKTGGKGGAGLDSVTDYILWYARTRSLMKYRQLHIPRPERTMETQYDWSELPSGERGRAGEVDPRGLGRRFRLSPLFSQSGGETTDFLYPFQGKDWRRSRSGYWKTTSVGMGRLGEACRLIGVGSLLWYVRYADDYPAVPLSALWSDTAQSFQTRQYVVQTNADVIGRCLLMTTDPGDLVFDPTCGSGTTAFCAEKWGRRWVTCDTSRVALAIARQRLLTAKYDYFELQDPERGPGGGFRYETVPHITLESIAKNPEIDAIAAKYQPEIDAALKELNKALGAKEISRLVGLARNDKKKGAESSAEGRRPSALAEWEVPREAGKDWPKEAKEAHRRFWEAKRRKRQEIDASIQRNAPQETLYDRPFKKKGVVRVTGPFTVEAIPAPALGDPGQATPVPQFEAQEAQGRVNDRAGDFLSDMIGLLRQQGGVLFPKGRKLELANIRPLNVGFLHAEAETGQNGKAKRVAISFGPQYGPVIAVQAHEAIQTAKANSYDILLIAGFSFEAEAQAFVQKAKELVRGLEVQFANIAPDVLVGDLLKAGRASQIFTGFGQPEIGIEPQKDGTFVVELKGVDVYDPIGGESHSASGADVAAWFLDTDYDGMTFHICQAFFPGDKDAWEKLQRALKAQIDPEAFEQMRGTTSFPFQPGKHKRIAVKVIDFRGNEVMGTRELGGRTEKER